MAIRYAILGLLARQPLHGYKLRAALEALVGGRDTWEIKPGQVYATLERLSEAGLIIEIGTEKEGGPEKRIYALTPSGYEALQRWLYSGVPTDHHKDEFFIKLMIGLLVKDTDLHRLIQIQRSTLYQELHKFTRQRINADPRTELAYVLFLDKVVMHLEADLRWLDMIEARLEEVSQQPVPSPEPKPRGRPPKSCIPRR